MAIMISMADIESPMAEIKCPMAKIVSYGANRNANGGNHIALRRKLFG
jgi:hypothetical protein